MPRRSLLKEYQQAITVGKDGEFSEVYNDWKKETIEQDPAYAEAFRRLETANSWKSLVQAMNSTGFLHDDFLEHAEDYDNKGDHVMASELRDVHRVYRAYIDS